jgi:hypothetical protein
MVTVTPDGRDGKFVIEYVKGKNVFLVRMLKPTWTVPKGSRKQVALRFGYGRIWNIDAIGEGVELRGALPLRDLDAFLSGFQSSGSIDITFVGGTEPPWNLATGGGGFVELDFLRCLRMTIPTGPTAPATQP